MPPIHVLHIGKTGGTALRHTLAPFADRGAFVLHPHSVRVRDCPVDQWVFVVVRHPIDRFVSGFNSRRRRGRPRYNVPWSRAERIAFTLFPTPDALAEAIGSRNLLVRLAARIAMRRIGHVRTRLRDWLGSADELKARGGIMIGRVETLPGDLRRLLALAGIDAVPVLPTDPGLAHATPAGMTTVLGAAGRANLARWFADDIALYERCLSLADVPEPPIRCAANASD